jgi:hypothetical protein
MERDPNDVVTVYSGPMVTVETYKQVLAEAGIDSRVVGEALAASFGSALPDSVELWVHQHDLEKAKAAIKLYEEQRPQEHPHFPPPTSVPKPTSHPIRKEPHIKQDPLGE